VVSSTTGPHTASGTLIPADILAKIIHWAIGGLGAFVDDTGREEFLRFRVRQVSTIWRKTSFSTPYLWHRLAVDTPDQHNLHGRLGLKTLVSRWFERGGKGAELHLKIGELREPERHDHAGVVGPLDGQPCEEMPLHGRIFLMNNSATPQASGISPYLMRVPGGGPRFPSAAQLQRRISKPGKPDTLRSGPYRLFLPRSPPFVSALAARFKLHHYTSAV
jgi:hypothetical protein